jgi:probable HAF family extracellular repeat protein
MQTYLLPAIVATFVLFSASTAGAVDFDGDCRTGLLKVAGAGPATGPLVSCAVLEVPGATGKAANGTEGTAATGINDRSQIVGWYIDAANKTRGFLRTNGQYFPIDVPNADETEAWGINSRTQIVGSYVINGQSHGFLLEDGHFTIVDPPGATSAIARGINDLGQIVGTYVDGGGSHGYLFTHGRFVTIDLPTVPPSQTEPWGINQSGQIVGYRVGGGSSANNFRLDTDGSVATLLNSPPGGSVFAFFPKGINDRGEIAGGFLNPGGFEGLLAAFGQEWSFSLDESTDGGGINNRGQVVGVTCSFFGQCRGFVLTPANIVADVSGIASPNGSRIPRQSVIVDTALTTWTLGPGEEILHDGAQAAGGYGSQILWYRGSIYVLGDDYKWWRWTGTTWIFAGANDPAS